MDNAQWEEFEGYTALLNAQLEVELPKGLIEALDHHIERLTSRLVGKGDWIVMLRTLYEIVGLLMLSMTDDKLSERQQLELAMTGVCLYIGRIISDPRSLPIIKEWGDEDL